MCCDLIGRRGWGHRRKVLRHLPASGTLPQVYAAAGGILRLPANQKECCWDSGIPDENTRHTFYFSSNHFFTFVCLSCVFFRHCRQVCAASRKKQHLNCTGPSRVTWSRKMRLSVRWRVERRESTGCEVKDRLTDHDLIFTSMWVYILCFSIRAADGRSVWN